MKFNYFSNVYYKSVEATAAVLSLLVTYRHTFSSLSTASASRGRDVQLGGLLNYRPLVTTTNMTD